MDSDSLDSESKAVMRFNSWSRIRSIRYKKTDTYGSSVSQPTATDMSRLNSVSDISQATFAVHINMLNNQTGIIHSVLLSFSALLEKVANSISDPNENYKNTMQLFTFRMNFHK